MKNKTYRNKIENLIIKTAKAGVELQKDDGHMPSGCNGPHNHNMTAARNTSHWAITFLHAYKISDDNRFRHAATKCLDLLVSPVLWPMGGAFWHRHHIERNSFNGLIGQSWSLEALYYGWKLLGDERYHSIGLDVFSQHLYDENLGLWYQLDLDGSAFLIEQTLNQQIWLAAMGAHLANGNGDILDRIHDFLSRLPAKIILRKFGVMPLSVLRIDNTKAKLKRLIRELFLENKKQRKEKEWGYHLFTLCGLAQIYEVFPNHEIWMSSFFNKALNFSFNFKFLQSLTQNSYGFPYNVPGFELPYIYSVFSSYVLQEDAEDLCFQCLSRQLSMHYNFESHLLELNTQDPDTLAARFYEICRIPREFFYSILSR